MPKYSGFDPIQSHNVVTTSASTGGIDHAGNAGDTVLYLPFDDDVNDDSLFNQTITNRAYNGNPITVDSSYSKFGGKSLRSWTGSSLKIHNSSSMDLNTSFTVQFFFRTNTQLSQVALYTHNDINSGSSNYSGLLFWIAGDNTLRLYGSSNGSSWNIFQNPTTMATISANNWHHVAITYDGSTYRGYYDGVRKWQVTSSTTLPTGGHSYILSRNEAGQYQAGTNNVRIDDFRITKGVALYTGSTYTVPTSALGLYDNNPVSLYLPFDSDLNDDSSDPFTITASGDAAISSAQSKFGGNSLALDGSGDSLSVASSQSAMAFSGDFTIEFWMYPTGLDGDYQVPMGCHNSSGWLFQFAGGGGRFWFGSSNVITTTATTSSNQWYHVAVSRSSGVVSLFIDGILQGTNNYTSAMPTNNDLTIGACPPGNQNFPGYLDDIRIIDGVGRYTKNFIPPSAAVGATLNGTNETNTTTDFTKFYAPFDSDLNDDAQYTLSGTASGSAAINTGTKQFGAASLYTPSDGDYVTYDDSSNSISFSGDYTIEAWVYFTDITSNNNYIWSKRTNTSTHSNNAWAFKWMGGSDNAWEIFQAQGGSQHVTFHSDTISTGVWYHLAVVRSGDNLLLFKDGVFISGTNTTGASGTLNNPASTNIVLGDIMGGTSELGFSGYIDDFRILDGYAKYTADFVPPTTAATTSVSETVNDLTVLYMPFDGTTKTVSHTPSLYVPYDSDFNDDSSYGHTGTTGGNPTISSTQSKFGGYSLHLDGNDYVSYGNHSSFDIEDEDFTIEGWAYRTSNVTYGTIAAKWDSSGNQRSWILRFNVNGHLYFYRSGDGNSYDERSGNDLPAIALNTWGHFAFVKRGRYGYFYRNGQRSTQTADFYQSGTSAFYTSSAPLSIGAINVGSSPTNHFAGYLDDIKITKGYAKYGLTNFTPPSSALGSGAETEDVLKGGFEDLARNHGVTKNGDATLNDNVKKFGTSSLYLDGTGDYLTVSSGSEFQDFNSAAFTIEGFFYCTNDTSNQHNMIMSTGTGSNSWNISITPYQKRFQLYSGGTAYTTNNTGWTVNTWHHFAVCFDGSTLRKFIDGSLISSDSYSNLTTTFSNIDIGRLGGDNSLYFNGYLDDLRIVKGHAKYTAAFTPPTSALGSEVSNTVTTVTTDTKTLSSTWTMTNDGSSPRSFIDMRSDNTWANNEHLQSSPDHRWNSDPGAPGTVATGGSIATPGNGYKYHVFTSPGTFELTGIDGGGSSLAVEYLVVAGGGGGGADRAAGGGAGGLRTNEDGNPRAGSAMTIATGSFPVVVGSGGAGGYYPGGTSSIKGGTSSFNSISATGGGNAGINGGGGTGGSGGGGTIHGFGGGANGNQGGYTPPEGNPGGAGGYPRGGGGGGGAGGAGDAADNSAGGDGGAGHAIPSFAGPILSPIIPGAMATAIGPTGLYAGGGGGAGQGPGGTAMPAGSGGPGGGGAGGDAMISPSSYNPTSGEYGPAGAPGVDGTGGGGGGAGNFPGSNPNMRPGGDGGNGVVIIKYSY